MSGSETQFLIIDPASGVMVGPEPPPVDGRSYLDRLMGAGVNVASVTLTAHSDSFDTFMHKAHGYLCLFGYKPDLTGQIKTVSDIHESYAAGKLGVVFGSQTGSIVGRDPWRWEVLRAIGLRICGVTYSERNALGDGCVEPENRGLTGDGFQAVREMNRLGITVDISHVGDRSSRDAIDASARPVIASHSNVRSLSPSNRNLPDDVIHALAARGGVVGISPFSAMCAKEPGVRPTLSDYLDMIEKAVEMVGIDHVGVGTDLYENYTKLSWESKTKRLYPSPWVFETRYAEGFDSVDDWPGVLAALGERGFATADIAKLLGLNWLRVFEETWISEAVPGQHLDVEKFTNSYAAFPS